MLQVLIVEDCPQLAFLWSEVLSDSKFECETVASTKEATSRLLRKTYDLVILDLFVDDGSTISLSDWISVRTPNLPILMITGSGVMAHGEHTEVAKGVSWLLRKPVDLRDLRAMADHLTHRDACPSAEMSARS
ncbi:response regulator [Poseidonocella sedimentorum]|uniref:Response regulator receiver domain-containing protein n=1 Tax=Poseidonocella sedimentorum TaxID=871652 RepID=A0A1I6DSW5_9RHOB|nr:response regulator [Poseidonocella sedimentorum]SFR08564.1 Response regulator receiver domain-containing protein [Poseidonocella sedimentorum]